ncbi:hypothetical protein FDENT_11480 [Fusarium denticulatum]|uniref:Uncharacterized protein n=1 Tax=Fusarium denticulatum TaxID=48507 RepID=A0A8H5TIK7_9HYPO|nr:hypothetical protein FDENT_11480 [Fusarium denticulatum]
MSGLGHLVLPHITGSAVRTLQVCSEDFLVEVFTEALKRAELTKDDIATLKGIERSLHDYTLERSKRTPGNCTNGCPSSLSTPCHDSTPRRCVPSEPVALKDERRKRKLLRRSGFLCTLLYDAGNNEQLADANHTFEVTLSGQLTCCPHGLPMQMMQDKDGNKKPMNDCFCSDYEMFTQMTDRRWRWAKTGMALLDL